MHLLFFDNEDRNDQVEFSGAVTKTFNQGLALLGNYYPSKVKRNTSESDKYCDCKFVTPRLSTIMPFLIIASREC